MLGVPGLLICSDVNEPWARFEGFFLIYLDYLSGIAQIGLSFWILETKWFFPLFSCFDFINWWLKGVNVQVVLLHVPWAHGLPTLPLVPSSPLLKAWRRHTGWRTYNACVCSEAQHFLVAWHVFSLVCGKLPSVRLPLSYLQNAFDTGSSRWFLTSRETVLLFVGKRETKHHLWRKSNPTEKDSSLRLLSGIFLMHSGIDSFSFSGYQF